MFATLAFALILAQDSDAELLKRIQPVVDRAGDLNPFVRAEAAMDAVRLADAEEEPLAALAKQKKPAAMAVLALAGKFEASALLKSPDRAAKRVACELVTPTKDQLNDVLRALDSKDLASRILACRALGRVEDQSLRNVISSALGQGMRRAGGADLLFSLVGSGWRGPASPHLFYMGDAEPERAALAVACLCNIAGLSVQEGYAPTLLKTLEHEKLDRPTRSLLIRVLGRRSPSAFLPLLSIRDARFRAEIVEVLDQALTDPLAAPSLFDAWRDAKAKKTDDGRIPAQPVSAWLESWMKRLCGDGVTPDTFQAWARAHYRTVVDRQSDGAVRRGVAGLQALMARESYWRNSPGGSTSISSLAAYALLKSGVPPEDPSVVRSLDLILDRDPESIYGTSLAVMALTTAIEKGTPRRERMERRLQRFADVIVFSQMKSGGWTYVARFSPEQTTTGWGYDLSNTQFALLGLRAAANAGAKIPKATWERSLAMLDKTQMLDGGWTYHGVESPSSPTMTAAGAGSWLLCRMSLDDGFNPHEAVENSRLREAVACLARSAETATWTGRIEYYHLYSVERFCMAAGIEKLGQRDWYVDGASPLIRGQGPDGLWGGSYSAPVDTCLALLFLRRAFIARPDIATESAQHRATAEQAQEVFERRREAMFVDGVRDLRLGQDAGNAFILVVVDSEPVATTVATALGREIDGVPVRVVVE